MPRHALRLAAAGLATLSLGADAQVGTIVPDTAPAAAVEACERSARQAVPGSGRVLAEVIFSGAPTVQPGPQIDGQIVLRGSGRWRMATGMRSFTYTCNVDPRTAEAFGVVLRDTTPVAAVAPARAPVEPDLSQLSPAACESNAAEALKLRWPQISKISFDTRTRAFHQPSANRALFHGSGLATPTADSAPRVFGFDCEIDPRDGRVLKMSLTGLKP